ncbi:MAG TPA: PAS domain-containing protein [Gemmatimonas sp.]|nr:PAS domain-containing protein [Gemmatimonas sp.]
MTSLDSTHTNSASVEVGNLEQALLDAVPLTMARLDVNGVIVSVNASWRTFGQENGLTSPLFAVGMNYLAQCEGADGASAPVAAEVAAGIRNVLGGTLQEFEHEYPCHSPTRQRWFRLRVSPATIAGSHSALVAHQDITEQVLAEKAATASVLEQQALAAGLEAERARLAEAQAVASVGSWETDLVNGTVRWSDETYRIFGVQPANFAGTHCAFLERVHRDDQRAVQLAFNGSFASAPGHNAEADVDATSSADPEMLPCIEHRIVTPAGTTKFVEERWHIRRDECGRPVAAVGTCQDTTDRRAAGAALRESEERFRQLAENIEEVFWITDVTKSQMIYISPGYEKIWGRSREALHRSPAEWMSAIHPEDADAVADAARGRQAHGQYDEQYRIVRPDGEVRWIRDRAFPVQNGAGETYRIVGIAEDITERRRTEAHLLRSQRMESLGTLAGGIAHDLNNALTPIMMSVDLLKESETDPDRRRILDGIDASVQQGADMVRQVLTFARGVEGRRIPLSMPQIIRDVGKIAVDTFHKNIRVLVRVDGSIPPVLGDPTQLHQVLLNLCVNARDAMPDGGNLTLSAEVERIDAQYAASDGELLPDTYVVMKVADTGTGMSKSTMDRIFEPFFTTKAQGLGTGLGLSTSLAIVKSHGAYLRVQSERGTGTTFSLFLPVEAARVLVPAEPGKVCLRPGRGELVLVVDDEIMIRDVTRRSLEANGYRVIVAADGADAVAAFASHRDDVAVVLADIMLPVMDGPVLLRVLRGMSPAVRIVAMSGLPDARLPEQFSGADAIEVLAKPFTTAALLAALADVLDRQPP